MGRISEWLGGRFARNQILFTGKRRHLTSMEVRGVQIAAELDGVCCRCRYLTDAAVSSAPALFWIIEPDLPLVKRFEGHTTQFFDPINPRIDPSGEFNRMNRAFKNILLNTKSSIDWLGPEREGGWNTWVIPHHHCNRGGYVLPEERLERPVTVGYLGQPEHLHDADAIQSAVEKVGLQFVSFDTWDLTSYQKIDIGIAWTRRDSLRDQTRSNIKMANFCAHGIPSVVCDYESYRDVDNALGGGAAIIRADLDGFVEGIAELAESESLRRSMSKKAILAQSKYSRSSIAELYRNAIAEARATE